MKSGFERRVSAQTKGCISADDLVLANKVEAMTGYGLSASDIACVLEIDEDALLADYGQQLRAGPIKANARVAESLYRKAVGDDRQAVTAAIFWLKTRGSWKETTSTAADVRVSFVTHEEALEQLD